jgi:hypothetical protein
MYVRIQILNEHHKFVKLKLNALHIKYSEYKNFFVIEYFINSNKHMIIYAYHKQAPSPPKAVPVRIECCFGSNLTEKEKQMYINASDYLAIQRREWDELLSIEDKNNIWTLSVNDDEQAIRVIDNWNFLQSRRNTK